MTNFFSWLYQHCELGNVNLRFIREGKIRNEFIPLPIIFENPERINESVKRNNGFNSFFGVSLREGNNGRKDGVIQIPALWVDLDGSPLAPLLESPWSPSAVIETSTERFHVYWKLREPAGRAEIGKAENLLQRLAAYFLGDKAATDASRILRIPGTLNFKNDPPFPVNVTSLNGIEYDLSDFADSDLPAILNLPENHPGKQGNEKGERIKKIMDCAFLQHCDKGRGNLPEPEWYAMVSILARETGGPAAIHWLSRGYPKYSPREADAKIIHALNTPPMTCQKLKTLWNCGKDCGVKSPATLSFKKVVPTGPVPAQAGTFPEKLSADWQANSQTSSATILNPPGLSSHSIFLHVLGIL